jgi:hypothetical protein
MTPLDGLMVHLRNTHPGITGQETQPLKSDGYWFLDIISNDHHLTVQWAADHGFGVSLLAADTGYGEAPDWHSTSLEETKARCDELLT